METQEKDYYNMEDIMARVAYSAIVEAHENYRKIDINLDYWIESGKKLIDASKHEEWDKCVRSLCDKKYCTDTTVSNHVKSIEVSLELLNILQTKNISEVAEDFDAASYPINVFEMVRNLILRFSRLGPIFYELTSYGDISPDEKRTIDYFKTQNREAKVLDLINRDMDKK